METYAAAPGGTVCKIDKNLCSIDEWTASPACGSFWSIGPAMWLFGFLGLRTDLTRRSLHH